MQKIAFQKPQEWELRCQKPILVVIFEIMGSRADEGISSDLAVQEGRPRTKEPPKFAVILHNDDYTTMEFVVEILSRFFQKTKEQAVQIMMQVHEKGRGVAGIYDFEIAETKVFQVHERAQSKGFPLKCTLEPVGN